MFKRLKLMNFRKVRDDEIFFVPGINVLRGANEVSKTTRLEGIAYVMFGARNALRDPIAETVTYGEKLSSLKAELDAEVNGVIYKGKRSNSGAEVWLQGGTSPLVTGQDECTKFWESLLGVSAKVASNLMLADQTGLRGTLSQGASAPVLLIETLANFKLIDTIIGLVQSEVPNGHTKAIEERIARLKEDLAIEVEDAVMPLRVAANDAATAAAMKKDGQVRAQKACDDHAPKAKAAQETLNRLDALNADLRNATAAVTRAEQAAQVVVPTAPDMTKADELRTQISDGESLTKAASAYAALQALGEPDVEWEGDMASLLAEQVKHDEGRKSSQKRLGELSVMIAQTEGRIIKETQCAFCDKNLSEVPEVVTRNGELEAELQGLRTDRDLQQNLIDAAQHDLSDLVPVFSADRARAGVYQKYGQYIELDKGFVPPRWKWIGPDTSKPLDAAGARIALKALEDAQRAHDRAAGQLQQAQEALAGAKAALQEVNAKVQAAEQAAAAAQPVLDEATRLADAFAQADAAHRTASQTAQEALGALQTAEAVHRERVAARERLAADLAVEESNLAETRVGNALLAKLRTARPQISDKLWAVVLGAVSAYFSTIRGVTSKVTRTDNGFQVDGSPITGLSGSTLDALGLAIRIALTKTFLPNARFMVLDEPAAACDDNRETNMIGLVAASDFDQVLLVTHSELADAFAQQVIQL